jgi:hypothetical protein
VDARRRSAAVRDLAEGTLGADGSFRIEHLPTDRPLRLLGGVGRARGWAEVSPLAPGDVRTVELTLLLPGALHGKVEDERFAPVEQAMLALFTDGERLERLERRVRTGADGS